MNLTITKYHEKLLRDSTFYSLSLVNFFFLGNLYKSHPMPSFLPPIFSCFPFYVSFFPDFCSLSHSLCFFISSFFRLIYSLLISCCIMHYYFYSSSRTLLRNSLNRDVSNGPLTYPLARSFAPLTHSLLSSWDSEVFLSKCPESLCPLSTFPLSSTIPPIMLLVHSDSKSLEKFDKHIPLPHELRSE